MFRSDCPLTVENARSTYEAGLQVIAAGQVDFDLSYLTAVDSSAVAILMAWQRAALARGLALKLVNPPASLESLAALYGVTELLHFSTQDHRD